MLMIPTAEAVGCGPSAEAVASVILWLRHPRRRLRTVFEWWIHGKSYTAWTTKFIS